jgi:hypothetical protein
MLSVLHKPAINPILDDFECEETKKLNKTFRLFLAACRTCDPATIFDTFEDTRQNHFYFVMRGFYG